MTSPIVLRRKVRIDAVGEVEQELKIDREKGKVVRRSWARSYYRQITLMKDKLGSYEIPVLVYITGHEIEGNNDWRTYNIIPTDFGQIDELLSKITDFDTFDDVIKCIHEVCVDGGDCKNAVCDLNICMGKYCHLCITSVCDTSRCVNTQKEGVV